ncbi:MAG: BlaI/MecI/CopY family transcriptional regulator [Chloroflexota bacterium]
MARQPRFEDVLGPLAAAITREVVELGETGVAEVAATVSRSQGREYAYTTIMTVMSRLYEKGVLLRDRRGRQFVYRAAAPEAELIDRLSGVAVERLLDRYGTAALRQFAVRLADLDPETRQRLTALAAEDE